MPILQLLVLAVVAMACLAAVRLVRVRNGRSPLPEGALRFPILAVFVILPPLVVGALADQRGSGRILGLEFLPFYLALLAGAWLVMSGVGAVVTQFAHGRVARLVSLALSGTEVDPDDVPTNAPLTPQLASSVASVNTANGAFPRGPEFPKQVDRSGFRGYWEALDSATDELERRIAEDGRLGLGVNSVAKDTAEDARSRLAMLRRMAGDAGQLWATA
ncbi:MAG TPA: hypothetical protein VKR30_02895 [Candidatus Limnocylindrales bacterium]|nr:hypothetical protein [Candidatus Limnocylindrales bacterium]